MAQSILNKRNVCFFIFICIIVDMMIYLSFRSPSTATYKSVTFVKNLFEKKKPIDILALQLVYEDLNYLAVNENPALIPIVERFSNAIGKVDAAAGYKPNISSVTSNSSTTVDVCPEKYLGTRAGYMYFVTGWEMENCTNAKPFHEILTILFFPADDAQKESIERVIKGIRKSYPLVAILVPSFALSSVSKVTLDNITSVNAEKSWSAGHVWNTLMRNVSTPYVFVGRDLDYFVGWLSRLERQVRVISTITHVKIAGGAVRNKTGHWQVGCYQSRMYNFILKYEEGYHTSIHECMYCDHLTGPFVARTEVFRKISLNKELPRSMLFEDFFLMVKQEKYMVLNCPDVMHMASNNAEWATKQNKQVWQPLVKKLELNRVVLPNGKVHGYSCEESGLKCTGISSRTNWFLIPPCCIEQYARAVDQLHQFAVKNKITYELDAGSALGIVKFNDYIPWDLDGDFSYYNNNYTLFKSSTPYFSKFGIKLKGFEYTNKQKTRSYFTYNTPDLYIECWGEQALSKDLYEQEIFQNNPTRVKLHDMWIYGSNSPGLLARNRYGVEILKHAHSWLQLGMKTSWENYKSGSFKECKNPKHHSCLDHFAADGNLQFKVPDPN